MKFQGVKGMNDLFSPAIEKWQVLEERSRSFFEAHGFREIRTPILERAELFTRSIGETSEIVHKEMYTFKDRAGRSLALRPEMTAAVVRAVIEHHLIKEGEPLFVYYLGAMFRAERPQAGRRRQFHQIGVETLNTSSATHDAELVILLKTYLEWLGLKRFVVKLNHLGSAEDRTRYARELTDYFGAVKSKLCPDCQYRLSRNILRIFDCKVKSCQSLINKAPQQTLSQRAKADFDRIISILSKAEVPFQVTPKLVRGLDYYTGCVFEVTAEGLGAQDAVAAGGRYDLLMNDLGGFSKGASGFSIGTERLLTSLDAGGVSLEDSAHREMVYVAALVQGEESCAFYRAIALALAHADKRAHFSFSQSSLSNHLKRANKIKAGYVLIVGEDEWRARKVSLKNMENGVQKRVTVDALTEGF